MPTNLLPVPHHKQSHAGACRMVLEFLGQPISEADLARARGLYNTYVTNGYMTAKALGLLVEAGLDAMNVDVKGDAEAVRRFCKGIYVEKVWRNCRLARELGVHLEITTLIIPGVNDQDEVLRGIAERIAAELEPDVPWHVSGYYPAYRFTAPATPAGTLERAWHITECSVDFEVALCYNGIALEHCGTVASIASLCSLIEIRSGTQTDSLSPLS